MNFKSVLNDVCCDNRIKDGVIDLKNESHVFVLQEYLENAGFDINTIVDKTAKLFEAGRFPERQAYNKDGILVTFPNKEYRDRAVNKGTHFAENPKKSQSNIFTNTSDIPEKPEGNVPIDTELDKDIVDKKEDEIETSKERTPIEKVQDAHAVDSILKGETPLVNYSVDEAKRYGFYNKGMIWFNSEGNLIGEQVFDENNNKSIIQLKKEVNLSQITSKALKKIDILDKKFAEILQKLKTGSIEGKDDTFKTDIYETLPLLVLYGIDLSDAKNLGGDSIPRALEFFTELGNLKKELENIKDPIKKKHNIKIYDAVIQSLNEIGGKDGVSLKDIISKPPTDFIHKSIENFYSYAKKYDEKFAGSEKNKKNTADVVLIYGGNKNDVLQALKNGEIENGGESIAKIKNKDIYFALVSLKAMSGRVGRVLTQLRDYLEADIEIQPSSEFEKTIKESILKEGFFDLVKNTFNKFIDKYKEISDKIKEKYASLIANFAKLTGEFIDRTKLDLGEKLNLTVKNLEVNTLKELKKIEDNIEKEINQNLNEKKGKSCDTNSAELTPSLIKNLEDYSKILSATNKDTALIEKIIGTAKNPTVQKYFKFEINEEELQQVKNIKQSVKSLSGKIISSKENCISRDTLSPVLMFRSNVLALEYIDLIMEKVLKNTNLSNPDTIQEEFLKLASVLSTEAIFGGNVSLPLIKYTGNKLERLGYKKEFEIKVPETIPDLKLGKLVIRLEPESKAYLVIYLYLFFGIETDDDKVTPIYVIYEMRSESGSSFTFKVEGNKFVNKI